MPRHYDPPEDSDIRPSVLHCVAGGAEPDGAANTSGKQSPESPAGLPVRTGDKGLEGVPASTAGVAPSKPTSRACLVCGSSLEGKKSHAKTCSPRCRKALERETNPKPPTPIEALWIESKVQRDLKHRGLLQIDASPSGDFRTKDDEPPKPIKYKPAGPDLGDVLDADHEAREAMKVEELIDACREHFGEEYFDNLGPLFHIVQIPSPDGKTAGLYRQITPTGFGPITDTTLPPERQKEEPMEAPTLIERVNALDALDARVREVERQIGVPEGGDKAAQDAVEALLADMGEET